MNEARQFVQQQGIYLLSHSIGLPRLDSAQVIQDHFFQPWQAGDDAIWDHWLGGIETFRNELAILLNTKTENLCPQTNISSGVTKIIQSLPKRSGRNKILLSEGDFPSVAYALQMAGQNTYQLEFIPSTEDLTDIDVWLKYLTKDIELVLITHVQSNNGRQLPVEAVISSARQAGIYSMVDVAQSAGILPINLTVWQPDFLVGSCVKWLCGGPGAAYLWISDLQLTNCSPKDVGWFSHQAPFEFDIHAFRYADSALKFWGGTPSVIPYVLAASSIKQANKLGVQNIRSHNLALSHCIMSALDDRTLASPMLDDYRGGTLILHFGKQQEQVIQALREHLIHFDARESGIRLSPHIYNTNEQVSTVADVLIASSQ